MVLPAQTPIYAPTSYVIDDDQGQLLGAAIASDGQWRFPYDPDVPEKFKQCIIAFEDKRFEHHPGFDILAFGRAIRQNIKAQTCGKRRQHHHHAGDPPGNQTQTNFLEQTGGNIYGDAAWIALFKDEILALYTSNAPFGSNVIGLDAASWRYFGRSPDKLSWGEMAAMAVLPNSPSLVHPGKNRLILIKKRNQLLDKLIQQGVIDSHNCSLPNWNLCPTGPCPCRNWPRTCWSASKPIIRMICKQATRITTTIKSSLQQQVNDILERHHQVLKANDINNIAAVVLDVETGAALAYAGNISHPEDT